LPILDLVFLHVFYKNQDKKCNAMQCMQVVVMGTGILDKDQLGLWACT